MRPAARTWFLFVGLAVAIANPARAITAVDPSATVTDAVTQVGVNTWAYSYSVTNTSVCSFTCEGTTAGQSIPDFLLAIRDFSLPHFGDAEITSIVGPSGWTFAIVEGNAFGLAGADTLVWTAGDSVRIGLGATLGGFGYRAGFAAGKGPFSTTIVGTPPFVGDPAIPLSPDAMRAGIRPLTTAVDEPATFALLAFGLCLLALVRRRFSRR